MGRDKALLPWRGEPLVVHVVRAVEEVADSVTLVGDPARYGHLGLPVIPDAVPGGGPLAGVYTALLHTRADWNLVVACDMPEAGAPLLAALFEGAERAGADCLIPAAAGRPQPLCAVYHRRAAGPLGAALERGVRAVREGIAALNAKILPWADDSAFQNCNTPGEWAAYVKTREGAI